MNIELTRASSAGLLAGFLVLCGLCPVQGFPPAPHHTLFGVVRNEWGEPIDAAGAEVLLESASGVALKTSMMAGLAPGVNYRLQVPMDSGATPVPYKPTASLASLPFRLSVRIGQATYVPMEMTGDPSRLGQPGQQTRIDLTLGEDTDGDGLPDAWERALLQATRASGTLADIRPGDDADGDGISNLREYLSGSYAFDPADGFLLRLTGIQGGVPSLEFLALRGRTYSIEASPDLHHWTPVQFRLPGAQGDGPLLSTYRATEVRSLTIEIPPQNGQGTNQFFKAVVQ